MLFILIHLIAVNPLSPWTTLITVIQLLLILLPSLKITTTTNTAITSICFVYRMPSYHIYIKHHFFGKEFDLKIALVSYFEFCHCQWYQWKAIQNSCWPELDHAKCHISVVYHRIDIELFSLSKFDGMNQFSSLRQKTTQTT